MPSSSTSYEDLQSDVSTSFNASPHLALAVPLQACPNPGRDLVLLRPPDALVLPLTCSLSALQSNHLCRGAQGRFWAEFIVLSSLSVLLILALAQPLTVRCAYACTFFSADLNYLI